MARYSSWTAVAHKYKKYQVCLCFFFDTRGVVEYDDGRSDDHQVPNSSNKLDMKRIIDDLAVAGNTFQLYSIAIINTSLKNNQRGEFMPQFNNFEWARLIQNHVMGKQQLTAQVPGTGFATLGRRFDAHTNYRIGNVMSWHI